MMGPIGPAGTNGYTPFPIWLDTSLTWDLNNVAASDTTPVDLIGPPGPAGETITNTITGTVYLPAIQSTSYTYTLSSGNVASIPLEIQAGQVIVIGSALLLLAALGIQMLFVLK
jgi:hypothetical protein